MNAMRHGILSERAPVLPIESAAKFATLSDELRQHLVPVGPIETELVQRVATLMWRLRRCALLEASLFA